MLCSLLSRVLPTELESPEVLSERMIREGFSLAVLQAAAANGSLHDVASSLKEVPTLGLRAGDRLAIAAAVKALEVAR